MNNHFIPGKVVITQLEVDNKPVEIGQKINNQVILKQGIPYTHGLTLKAANNSFSLMFSNLTYSDDLQKYNYRLSPAQSNWLTINEGEKVSYANLPQGKYVFEVQSIMADGSSGYLTSMDINILPHWYEAIWFRLLIIITIGFIIYYLMRRVKKEQARLRHEERLKHELFVANLEREKEKQINRERSNFFTNVSHELRTPLTLILSPLQELLQTERFSQILYDKLSLVYNNATSLSTLVNQLLYVQKIEAGMVQLKLSEVDISVLVKNVITSFKHIAEIKQTEFILDSGKFPVFINRNKMLHTAIETEELPAHIQPKQIISGFMDTGNFHIKPIRTEILYIFSIITAQTIICAKPHKTIHIFMNTQDCIIGQSVLHGEHPDILFKKGITGKTIKNRE